MIISPTPQITFQIPWRTFQKRFIVSKWHFQSQVSVNAFWYFYFYGVEFRSLNHLKPFSEESPGNVSPLVADPGLWSTSSIVVAHRLSCSRACGIFLDQESNLCLMHWQADSLPLSHQGSPLQFLLLLLTFSFLFYFGVQLINKVMSVSVVQQSDSVIHTHVSSLFQILFPFRLSQNIKQRSLCYIIGPCWLCFKQSSVHMSVPNS